MSRRASLPGADELFRNTAAEAPQPVPSPAPAEEPVVAAEPAPVTPAMPTTPNLQVASPIQEQADIKRPRHEEKVTFYCTGSDLTRLERARLTLRAEYRLASDRGRIVRAALSEILDDFETRGPGSALVRRLQQDRESPQSTPGPE